MKTVDFLETIAASDLKVGRSRHLIKYMKVCELVIERLIDYINNQLVLPKKQLIHWHFFIIGIEYMKVCEY